MSLGGVVARLVLRGRLAGVGRHLLEERQDLGRSRRVGLVEERDDVLGFVLRGSASGAIDGGFVGGRELTKRNMMAVGYLEGFKLGMV